MNAREMSFREVKRLSSALRVPAMSEYATREQLYFSAASYLLNAAQEAGLVQTWTGSTDVPRAKLLAELGATLIMIANFMPEDDDSA